MAGGTALIKPWEGLELQGYADPIGIPTDCYGNTHGAQVGVWRTIEQCEALLSAEVRRVAQGLARCVTRPVYPHEAAALISWAYNVGTGAACGSTLVRKLNAGMPFCAELDRWVYAGGRKWQGLVNRRAAERAVCEGRHGQASAAAGGLAHAGPGGAGRRPAARRWRSRIGHAVGAQRAGRG
jgi:lysozyme